MSIRLTIAVGVGLVVAACGGSSTDTDLLFDLSTVNAIAAIGPDQVIDRGTDEVTERTGAVEAVIDDLLLYEIAPPDNLVSVDGVSVMSDEGLWFYRDPSYQIGLPSMIEGAAMVVVALEQRPVVTDLGIGIQGRVVVLDEAGAVLGSDWPTGTSADQLSTVAAVVAAEGHSWSEALAALAVAARDEALDRDITDPLGARLLEAARAAG